MSFDLRMALTSAGSRTDPFATFMHTMVFTRGQITAASHRDVYNRRVPSCPPSLN
jgi:hypothetical protein